MQPITITTVVRNPATLPLLLALTDKFYSDGLLTKLRVVDYTPDATGTIVVRGLVPMDGSSNTRSIVVDYSAVQQKDPRSYISTGVTGYHYKTTGFKLQKNGDSVTVAMRSTHGGSVWVSAGGRGAPGIEVVLSSSGCFIRRGKGGGTKVQEVLDSGVVDGGTGWRTIELSWSHDGQFVATLDTGSVLTCVAEFSGIEVDVNISSSPTGIADIVATSLSSGSLGPGIDRSYAYYYKQLPPEEIEGFELVSSNDIVYIDPVGWQHLLDSGVVLAVGDNSHIPALRRAGVLKQGLDVHASFLDRSYRCIEKMDHLISEGVSFNVADGTHVVRNGVRTTIGLPALLCVLDEACVNDLKIIDRYSLLINDGPIGDALTPSAEDVLAYLDSIITNSKADEFFIELAESLNPQQKIRLIELLSRR